MDDRVRSVMEEVLSKLKTIWVQDPDMRFGQLAYNLFWQMQDARKEGITGLDMFCVEDDSFERRLDEVIREGWQSPR